LDKNKALFEEVRVEIKQDFLNVIVFGIFLGAERKPTFLIRNKSIEISSEHYLQ
jgi:hypothetical protein